MVEERSEKGGQARAPGRDPLMWPWGPGCLQDVCNKVPRASDTWLLTVLLEAGSSGCSKAGELLKGA